MKKFFIIFAAVCATFSSCKTNINESMFYATVGKDKETTPPAEVKSLQAVTGLYSVVLRWENPTDEDFYGITISSIPAEGSLSVPLTFMNDDRTKIPTTYTVTGLSEGTDYTFKINAFDKNKNTTAGISILGTAKGEVTEKTGNFSADSKLVGYKKDLIAFDFGYCDAAKERTLQLNCTKPIDISNTSIDSSVNTTGTGSYTIVSCPSGTVKVGDKISIVIKYTPPAVATPSWDEADLIIGGDAGNKIRLIGSNYKQPNCISKTVEEKEYGLKLWLRADLITSADLTNSNQVLRFPDYSGRNLHAYNTDSSGKYAPVYMDEKDVGFNGLPGMNFATNDNNLAKSQFLSMNSGADPIISSSQGSTTFVVMITPVNNRSGTLQTIISCNYGQSYPTLVNTHRYFDSSTGYGDIHNGMGIRGSGLYGTYRYPCINNNLDDENNKWYENVAGDPLSICMVYDQTIKPEAVTENRQLNFPSNIRMQINGTERLLAYIHSNNTTTPIFYTYKSDSPTFSTTCNGAYGKPIGDGKGHRYGTLSQVNVPSADTIRKAVGVTGYVNTVYDTKLYENWNKDRKEYNVLRQYDYAYSLTPYLYELPVNNDPNNSDKKTDKTYSQSFASTDDAGCPNAAYFNNWISTEDRRNGTIYSVIIGADNAIASYSRGKIAEVFMFDYALSAEEISAMNKYIYNRYKIGTAE